MAQALRQIPTADETDVVVLRVPAESAYLSVLRTATAGLAARLHFTLDEIEDLRIAVDEACAMLVADASGDGDLECEFSVTEASLSVAVSVPAEGAPRLPSVHTFAWKVLSTLAGEVRAEHSNGRATIWLNKRRANQP